MRLAGDRSASCRLGAVANANPAFIAMPPRSVRRAISPPSPAQVTRLIGAAEPDSGLFILLAATTGARRGELCGLRWSDRDFAESEVDIIRAVIVVDGHCQVAPTKTRQTRRALTARQVQRLRMVPMPGPSGSLCAA